MSDALPLPPHPNLDQYKKLAKDLQHACRSADAGAIRGFAKRWLEKLARLQSRELTADVEKQIERESGRMLGRWQRFNEKHARAARCLLADAQFFLAREHGFLSWPEFVNYMEELRRADSSIAQYEAAVDAIVTGDAKQLGTLLRRNPELIRARSSREHRSTLLHYVSANGIEDFRQKTPPNIVEITRLLLDAGADVNAESEAYGGGSTVLGLVATSVHPEEAGVQIELMEVLLERGAEIEKPGLTGNKHRAIWGCLANGQPAAAKFFADRGARMTFEEAAGLGRLDVVETYFDENGKLKPGTPKERLDSGFMYACGYGHAAVVKFLLERGIDPATKNDRGSMGLHWASFGPHPNVARVLLEHGAPVNAEDDTFKGTPLRWAIYDGWAKAETDADRERARELVRLLVQAGSNVDREWVEGETEDPVVRSVRGDPAMMSILAAAVKRHD
jgi:ankyrin repeat protein